MTAGRWLGSVSFRTKFLLFGLLLAGPLAVAAGFALATFGAQVTAAQKRTDALQRGKLVRALLVTVARHRGLSATLLAGDESQSSQLVSTQQRLLAELAALQAGFATAPWAAAGPPDLNALGDELRALMRLSETRSEQANFMRHTAVTEALLSTSRRIGGMFGVEAHDAGPYALTYVELPTLVEALGRQRGWGSAVLAQARFDDDAMNQYLLYAGGVQQVLRSVESDVPGIAALDAALATPGNPNALRNALAAAAAFMHRSMAQLERRDVGDTAASEHFEDGSQAIDTLAIANDRTMAVLESHAQAEMTAARQRRNASLGFLLVLTLALGWVYRAFLRSTVDRLRVLERSSQRLAGGDFDAAIAVDGRDEIARLAEALDAMRAQLRDAVADRANALAAQQADRDKTEFLARWSHDLRTPLNAIIGFGQILDERTADPLTAAQRSDLQHIRRAAAHMLDLVNDVLQMASAPTVPAPTPATPVDMAPVVEDAVAMVMPAARSAGVSLTVHHVDPAWTAAWVQGDRTRLLQLLSNVLSNAVKFNRRGGRVDLLTLAEPATADDAGRITVSVIDSGIGMSPAQLARLFMPYERLGADALGIPGTGLGLSNARQLLEAMGGRIEVTSLPGEGSRFDLSLLRAAPPTRIAGAAHPAPRQPSEPPLRGRLAYVEDEPVNALVLQALLRTHTGLSITVFDSGAAALAGADDQHFDLWLLDRNLPDIDGIALSQRLALGPPARRGALRAVIVSADGTPAAREQALAAGCLGYWVKPLDRDRLVADLRALLGGG